MKTVVLTGATGYIGQNTIKFLLAENYTVHAVSSKSAPAPDTENLIWHQANLFNRGEVESVLKEVKPSHLLHFAWYVEHAKFWSAAENLDHLSASLRLARAFAECGGQRMVTAGTCAEYDWTAKGAFKENTTPCLPQSLYGVSKYAMNSVIEKEAALHGISFAVGRIFFPFGGAEPAARLIPSVIDNLLTGRRAATTHGGQVRDFIHVEDVAEAFVALLGSGATGAVNIGSGAGLSIKVIVQIIGDLIEKPHLLDIGAIDAADNEPPEIVADIGRLRREVKFNKEFNLRRGLIKTVNYRRNEINNRYGCSNDL